MTPKTVVLTTCGQKDPNVIFEKLGDASLAVLAESQLWELHFTLPRTTPSHSLLTPIPISASFVLLFYSSSINPSMFGKYILQTSAF